MKIVLDLSYQHLKALPELPEGLELLYCYHLELTSLPELPKSLKKLICYDNEITVLPELPDSLLELVCNNNPLECLIPTKFLIQQYEVWLREYYYPYIESYKGQKKILERITQGLNDVSCIKELLLQTKLHPKIKEEFAYILNACNLNLI